MLGRVKDHSAEQQFCETGSQGRLGRVKNHSAERFATRPGCWSLGRVTPPVDDFSPFGLVFENGLSVDLRLILAFYDIV